MSKVISNHLLFFVVLITSITTNTSYADDFYILQDETRDTRVKASELSDDMDIIDLDFATSYSFCNVTQLFENNHSYPRLHKLTLTSRGPPPQYYHSIITV